jgi:hypothetical protein
VDARENREAFCLGSFAALRRPWRLAATQGTNPAPQWEKRGDRRARGGRREGRRHGKASRPQEKKKGKEGQARGHEGRTNRRKRKSAPSTDQALETLRAVCGRHSTCRPPHRQLKTQTKRMKNSEKENGRKEKEQKQLLLEYRE